MRMWNNRTAAQAKVGVHVWLYKLFFRELPPSTELVSEINGPGNSSIIVKRRKKNGHRNKANIEQRKKTKCSH